MSDTLELKDLTEQDCPLLGDQAAVVIGQFNQALQVLRQIQKEFPQTLESDGRLKKSIGQLMKVRADLARERYKVGFTGTTGTGKSTTINHLVEEGIALEGTSTATTCTVTRVHPSKDLKEHTLSLFYLTEEKYRARRNNLCTEVELNLNKFKSDKEILAILPQHRKDTQGLVMQSENCLTLENLVKSYLDYSSGYVHPAEPGRKDTPGYEKRHEFLNHTPDAKGGSP